MNADSGATRWWENYLVRYLMPSIAGVGIISWLCIGNSGLRDALLLPSSSGLINASSLTLLFLYANFLCYVASYPVLIFHVTRVIDFRNNDWPARRLLDGYLITSFLTAVVLCSFRRIEADLRFWLAFVVASIIGIVQLLRLFFAMSPRLAVRGLVGRVSPAFGYTYSLARRRGIANQTEGTSQPSSRRRALDIDAEDEVRTSRTIKWRPEFIETYRHMREHANSAYIFLCELLLGTLIYCVSSKPGQTTAQELSAIGSLLGLWAAPSIFVHLLGQHLERRFARYEDRIRT